MPESRQTQLSSRESVKRFFRLLEKDRALEGFGTNSIVECLSEEDALALANQSDERRSRNEPLSPIDGLVVTVKDTASLPVAGWTTTYGSWYWPKDRDRFDAPAVAALRNVGCIIIGRTTSPEFAWKGATSSLRFGITRSAIDLTRTSGGSSGGAASSVAAGMADLAVGTDAGGSVRIPAAIQGLVGFKPTAGLIKSSSSSGLSEPGLIARTVPPINAALDVILNSTRTNQSSERLRKPLRLAFSRTLGGLCSPNIEIADRVRSALDEFAQARADVTVEELELTLDPAAAWNVLLTLQFAKHAEVMRHFGLKADSPDLDPGLKVLISDPMFKTAPERVDWARSERLELQQSVSRFQSEHGYDLIVTPTVGREPAAAASPDGDYLEDGRPFWQSHINVASHTFLFNLTGQPALAIPCGFTHSGQPVSLQLVGAVGADMTVLEAGKELVDALRIQRGTPAVVLINGPSSAGKTSLAKAIKASAPEFAHSSDVRFVSFDDFALGGMPTRHWSKQFVEAMANAELLGTCVGPEAWHYESRRATPEAELTAENPPSCELVLSDLGLEYLYATFRKWATMLRCGISLVIDHYVANPLWYRPMIEEFAGTPHKVISIGLFCDSSVLQVREGLRSQMETRICGTAHFSETLVHEVLRGTAGVDYDLEFRSDSEEELAWAVEEYKTVVLDRQQPTKPKPSSSASELAETVLAALVERLR